MLIWFAVLSAVAVAEIFGSPLVDYRLVVAGSLVPLIDIVIGQPTPLHTMVGPVVVLALVMAATVGRRLLRRRLLGVPIGMFLHLVLDASWNNARLFWWPFFGADLSLDPVPETTGVFLRVALDLVAFGVAGWAYRRYGLGEAENRNRLVHSGHLNRAFMSSPRSR